MIETLFKANGPNMGGKDGVRRSIMPLWNEETRVLDPKKSQNIAILLKALNVTEEEVCEALLEGILCFSMSHEIMVVMQFGLNRVRIYPAYKKTFLFDIKYNRIVSFFVSLVPIIDKR